MSPPAPAEEHWEPELPFLPETEYQQPFPIGETARYYIVRTFEDERRRLAKWAIIQQRRVGGEWLNVAVYDVHPPKGFHVHYHDNRGSEFVEVHIHPVRSYEEFVAALDHATLRVSESWEENERRSDRGK
jgi:hypothetical protein